jgi:hypothetical protein
MSYFIASADEHPYPFAHAAFQRVQKLGDFSDIERDGSTMVVFTSFEKFERNKPHAFYVVQDGVLKRNKYRTAMHQIKEMFK